MTRIFFGRVVCFSITTAFASSAVFAAPVYYPAGPTGGSIIRTATGEDQNFLPRHHDRLEFRGQQSHTGGGGNSK